MMWGYGMGGAGWIFMLLTWALVILGIVLVVRSLQGRGDGRHDVRHDARRILDERFAAGEISPEEYEQRRRVLG